MSDSILNKKIKTHELLLSVMFVLSALTGMVNQQVLSMGIMFCCIGMFFLKKLPIAFPFIIFYNELYGKVFGLSLLRIFSILLILGILFKMQKEKKLKVIYLIPIGVYLFFLISTMSNYSIHKSIFGFVDVMCNVFLVTELLEDNFSFRRFFRVYVIIAIISFFTGLIIGNALTPEDGVKLEYEYTRYVATFEDPNYMGFFFNIAIFATVILKLFRPWVRISIVIILEIMLIASVSITAIIINIIVWIICILLIKKKYSVGIISLLFIICAMSFAYSYGLNNPDVPFLGPMSYRINEKIVQVNDNDLSNATTGRVDLSKWNMAHFKSLPVTKQIFGGTSVNMAYVDTALPAASHNDYIDMLLNVGYIGAFLMCVFLINRLSTHWKNYKQTGEEMYIFLFVNKLMYILYGMALTLFLDYRFMLIGFM